MKSLKITFFLFVFGLSGIKAQTYTLVWEDNFNGTTLDSSKWNIEQKVGIWNTGANSEFQHYKKENVSVGDDGAGNNCLILTAKKENYNGYNYTSGKVTTKGKFAFRRGKFEASIKIPDLANGLWPAFWSLGYSNIGWPDCGEIDVLEMGHKQGITDGVQNKYLGSHLFWGPYPSDYGKEMVADDDLSTGYFKHTAIWDETKISIYFNDATSPYFSMGIDGSTTEEFREFQEYLLLNLAVGGSLPGIYNINDITVATPANMYVDWVKVYQEEDKIDYSENELAQFGVFGVFEETVHTDMGMDLGFDLMEITTALTPKTDETPYEGNQVLSYSTSSGADYKLKLTAGILRNMINYNTGSVQFYIKTNITDAIQIGIADTEGLEHFVTFDTDNNQNFSRNNSWQLAYLSLSDFKDAVNLASLKDMLICKGTSSSEGYISIDQITYKETVPARGYYAIATDNPEITEGFVVDGVTNHMYIWSNTIAFNTTYPAYEGENVLSFKATGAESWCGFGFISSTPLNFEAYADGYLNISIRTTSSKAFYIGMDGVDSNGEINFVSGSDPYGFKRDGKWHHLHIPFSDLTSEGLDLSNIKHVFKTGSGVKIDDIAYDNIFYSEQMPNIENTVVCYTQNITVYPGTKTIYQDEKLKLTAKVLNQFGNAFENYVSWTSDGGEIDVDGNFQVSTLGDYTITATQDEKIGKATITVLEGNAIFNTAENLAQIYFVQNTGEIVINGVTEPSTITLFNTCGATILTSNSNQLSNRLKITHLAAGMYVVKITSANNSFSKKIIMP